LWKYPAGTRLLAGFLNPVKMVRMYQFDRMIFYKIIFAFYYCALVYGSKMQKANWLEEEIFD